MARRSSYAKKIDFKQWDGIPGILRDSASEGTATGGGLSFVQSVTILRCRTSVILQFDETRQAGDQMDVGLGLAIVSTDAATLGATAVPDPLEEPEFPWLYWVDQHLECINTGSTYDPGSSLRWEVDTKAMRKVKPSETLIWVS